MPQTALIIAIPEADARFGALRRRFDPQADLGVPAHVTILFPFMAPDLVDDAVRRRLAILFKRFSPFRCVLDRVERFPETAWLAPVFPAPFVELTQAVTRAFPDFPPYGGAHASIVPHLTIAQGDAAVADEAERELRADLAQGGPVVAHCKTVRLLENASGDWRPMHEFALVGHQGWPTAGKAGTQLTSGASLRKNAMSRFEVFIGTWNTTGNVLETPANAAGRMVATDVYRWLPGKHFIVHDVDARFDGQPARSMEVMGFDEATGKFFARSFDDQGGIEVSTVALDGRRWTIEGKAVRFDGAFDAKGARLEGWWERKVGRRWLPWIELRLVRA